jgi:hypothetical protein
MEGRGGGEAYLSLDAECPIKANAAMMNTPQAIHVPVRHDCSRQLYASGWLKAI